ncbi:lipopolysaccharide kinase InaA family protein [Aquimarina sp. 2201CG14-23]|uniref:lipopolysaccharide kinase InaA family protein n=1 Tax=Aquimarina mycalae TaxID=3040073 RepID=UPI002477D684|nr:lipopolysaccharide kinase InaA family protein [Aquimarina sp. 2201CG14-23]MDH7447006.1 lipopolysaccharide kinase InaA family protein [Aquimarina sp. 2201CG14-23]
MPNRFVVHDSKKLLASDIKKAIDNFEVYTEILGDAERNVIKIAPLEDKKATIKSFRIPNVINQIAYRFFRKSKAERSYMYANKLLEAGIKTPFPIAYEIQTTPFLFKKSYYVSELIECDLTYRELTTDFSISDHEEILRAFTRFTYELHKHGINFLDHSPGNTLIKRTANGYDFYLVDLNRMEFGDMNFETRIKNFARLTIHESMIKVMSNEYAKCTGEKEAEIFKLMWQYTQEFQNRYHGKRKLKRKIFFWKKKYRE